MATKKSAEGASAAKKTRSSTTRKTTKKATKKVAKKAVKKTSSTASDAPSGQVVVEREIGGRTLTLETGRMAKLSDGAVLS